MLCCLHPLILLTRDRFWPNDSSFTVCLASSSCLAHDSHAKCQGEMLVDVCLLNWSARIVWAIPDAACLLLIGCSVVCARVCTGRPFFYLCWLRQSCCDAVHCIMVEVQLLREGRCLLDKLGLHWVGNASLLESHEGCNVCLIMLITPCRLGNGG